MNEAFGGDFTTRSNVLSSQVPVAAAAAVLSLSSPPSTAVESAAAAVVPPPLLSSFSLLDGTLLDGSLDFNNFALT